MQFVGISCAHIRGQRERERERGQRWRNINRWKFTFNTFDARICAKETMAKRRRRVDTHPWKAKETKQISETAKEKHKINKTLSCGIPWLPSSIFCCVCVYVSCSTINACIVFYGLCRCALPSHGYGRTATKLVLYHSFSESELLGIWFSH